MGLVFRETNSEFSISQKENIKELTSRNASFLRSIGFIVNSKRRRVGENVGHRKTRRIQ